MMMQIPLKGISNSKIRFVIPSGYNIDQSIVRPNRSNAPNKISLAK